MKSNNLFALILSRGTVEGHRLGKLIKVLPENRKLFFFEHYQTGMQKSTLETVQPRKKH